ncbi:MAG: DUF992 domain-containing protein [Xanthobacteraceae bacterium]|nr:DUF992 domain-containing protein [Xanthobacteraceae bacterium]PWB65210.1 MAG: DUF992 domain-containing protein [Bradyrhizobiaceae bacterium]
MRLSSALFASLIAVTLGAGSAAAQQRVQTGTLACDVSAGLGLIVGSQRSINCSLTPAVPGPIEHYVGTITKVGIDLGVTTPGQLVWAVYAPTTRMAGALAGTYAGATAEASVGAGLGANVLIGGSDRTVALQPLSIQGQAGLNVAAGVAEIQLRFVR